MVEPVSTRSLAIFNTMAPFFRFVSDSVWTRRSGDPSICDFVFGNPHEMPLAGFTAALQRWTVPQNQEWHAYKLNEESAQRVIATALHEQRGVAYALEDIFLTNGAFAALTVTLNAIVNPGDEVIFISPPWFFYEALIVGAGGQPVRVKVEPETFDLDIAAIRSAITPQTRAIIVNSPHNPTGKIYSPQTLTALAGVLTEASNANGRPIYLLSDEAYCRIIFDGRSYPSPTTFYPNSFLIYTYGKILLTPGERLGYIALSPEMADREALRLALFVTQFATGYAFPNAVLQHAIGDLDKLSIDIAHLQEKRDWMVSALREMGYSVHTPEGTFYLLVKSPISDDSAFADLLAEYDILCLPGYVAEMPGYFRLSLTANDEMIQRALPGFAAALERARTRVM
ncbi:MAG: aminotransferase class I/II-fold pyridoxal phosphate-dependent enzyme [Caldilineaceae bacterium]|nr:aminotransferase class I/II-fold pyridoxal phosphate-dependent enzyme [Caldilineaceae bacterium]